MKPLVIGHRGYPNIPENTMASFIKAYELGADGIELDVHLTKDKKLVVIHDPTVDRTTDGKGFVANKTLKRLKLLDAGNGQKIPTLEQVFKKFENADFKLLVEIKDYNTIKPLVKLIAKYKYEDRVIIFCFAHKFVEVIKKLNPKIKTAINIICIPIDPYEVVKSAKADIVSYYHQTLIAGRILLGPMIKKLHKQGTKVYCTPVDTETTLTIKELQILRKMGIDGFISNKVDKIMAFLGKKKREIKKLVKKEKKKKKKETKFERNLNHLVELHRRKIKRDMIKFKKFIKKLERDFFS